MQRTRLQRKRRVRARIFGTAERPRVSVWRSNRSLGVQFIDDVTRQTLMAVDSRHMETTGGKTDVAREVGAAAAAQAKERGITYIVFDRGEHRYHGRVKAVAEALRAGGLEF